jgi:thymidylate kinase
MLELSSPLSKEADAIIAALLPRYAWSEDAVEAFVAKLRRNRYPLLALEAAGNRHPLLVKSAAWTRALTADRRSHEEQRYEFVQVKRAWDEAGIASVLFKSGGLAPSFPYTSDNVDVLVPRNRTLEARQILLALGYVWLRNIDETQKWLFRKFDQGRSVSAIHVHGWVGWDVEFHERAIWDGIRQSPDDTKVVVPSREDALLINAAHALYENKEIRLYDLEKIRAQWQQPLDWDYIEGIARRRGWLDGLYFALLVCQKLERDIFGYRTVSDEIVARWESGLRHHPVQWFYWKRTARRPLALPFCVWFAFSKLLYYKKITRDSHDGLRARARNVVRTLAWGAKQKSKVRPQRARLIAISGLDGAGKSAHVARLSEALETSEVINRVVWSRIGTTPLYRAARSLFSRGNAGANNSSHDIDLSHRSGFVRNAWAWANALDLALTYQWKVRLPLLTGKVVICDRYTADAAVEIAARLGKNDPMSVPAVRALMRLTPRPQTKYLLDLPAEVAAFRSVDSEDPADLRTQRDLYQRVAEATKMQLLDASGEFAAANNRLVRRVLQDYEDKFSTFTNGLFLSNPRQLNADEAPTVVHPQLAEPPTTPPQDPPDARRSRA